MTGMLDLPVGGEGGRPCACVWIIDGKGGSGCWVTVTGGCCCCFQGRTSKSLNEERIRFA